MTFAFPKVPFPNFPAFNMAKKGAKKAAAEAARLKALDLPELTEPEEYSPRKGKKGKKSKSKQGILEIRATFGSACSAGYALAGACCAPSQDLRRAASPAVAGFRLS